MKMTFFLSEHGGTPKTHEAYQTHHPAVVVFLCVVYAALSLVAFSGNALIIWIIRELQQVASVAVLIG